MLRRLFEAYRLNRRRKRYFDGAKLCRMLAPDIRRDVEIIDASEVERGFVVARIRTWNVLYAYRKIVPMPEFSEPKRIEIEQIWDWKGAPWGGPVPKEE